MPQLPIYGKRPVVLLTNDDGPPSDHSPNIYTFAKHLIEKLGWDVRVVVPDSQKSWVGKGYAIQQIIEASFFYPLEPDGRNGEITPIRRPLKEGEMMEWVLINSTPATCANVGLHNLYPGEIDLVISGPNHGRNSSTAFALSSGTIGAALAGTLAVPIPGPRDGPSLHTDFMPSIAISYGVVKRPVPEGCTELANDVAVDVCKRLFDDWGFEDADSRRPVQCYTVNVPLVLEALQEDKRRVCFTTMWRNTYGPLFTPTLKKEGGWNPADLWKDVPLDDDESDDGQLRFAFAPNFHPVLYPDPSLVPAGTDAWAFYHGYTSVTPIRAEFAGLHQTGSGFGSSTGTVDNFWT